MTGLPFRSSVDEGGDMRKLFLGVTAAVAMATPAVAADLPVKAPPLAVAGYSWTGCYVGVAGGFKWARARDTDVPTGLVVADTFSPRGGIVGGTVGCNYQPSSTWVLGVEGDWSWLSVRGDTVDLFAPATFRVEVKEQWLATLRGRAGITY